ncbi:MAG: tetratricopeptide repeat protein [Rhodospirillales bacterium]|nr:tetratricopeptide repeat protein [Rhodospirillales bacterium]
MTDETIQKSRFDLLWYGISATLLLISASYFVAILQANSVNGLALNEILMTALQGAGLTLIGSGALTSGGQESVRKFLNTIGIPGNLHGPATCAASAVLLGIGFFTHQMLDDYYYDQGMAHYEAGDLTESRDAFLHALQLNDQDLRVHLAIGRVYETLGDLEEAQGHYIQSVEEGFPDGFNRLGHVLIHSDETLRAEALLRLGLQRSYGHGQQTAEALDTRHLLHRNLGWALINQEKYPDALNNLQAALDVYAADVPKDASKDGAKPSSIGFTYCLQAYAFEKSGKVDDAKQAWTDCLNRAQPEMISEFEWLIKIGRSDIASCIETRMIVAGVDPTVHPLDLPVCVIKPKASGG